MGRDCAAKVLRCMVLVSLNMVVDLQHRRNSLSNPAVSQVLARLLPLALDRLGSPYQASRTKVRMRLRFGCTDQATATCWRPKHS